MPRDNKPSLSSCCDHLSLGLDPSTHASEAGYARPTARQRAAAASRKAGRATARSKKSYGSQGVSSRSFPGPLILPGDDLALEPDETPQSFQEWLDGEHRNEVTPARKTVYVAAAPDIDDDVKFIRSWSSLQTRKRGAGGVKVPESTVEPPHLDNIVGYLKAFYHGLPVKVLPSKLCFTSWDSATPSSRTKSRPAAATTAPRHIGLNTGTECVRIRTRVAADKVFPRQLNLDDLLDAAISMLPDDAYALVMLVDYDLYEDDDDIFVCGRAYGGSRVAVVSTARYHPALDREQDVERQHAWPASHCEVYMKACCVDVSKAVTQRGGKKRARDADSTSSADHAVIHPLRAAVSAHEALPSFVTTSTSSLSMATLSGLWLGRVCRTASHELGHCFGIGHCPYYACTMQGSASLAEDARQPPYLCPIDLVKVLHATGTTAEQHYLSLLSFCDKHDEVHLFSALGAWIRARIEEMEQSA
ncbi:hypothetical protein FQN54_007299 [Arachnomyces sp. PD_36]|nr:hypothetical protein FQN54_007299 [Arachnomyces sp. PD_36]